MERRIDDVRSGQGLEWDGVTPSLFDQWVSQYGADRLRAEFKAWEASTIAALKEQLAEAHEQAAQICDGLSKIYDSTDVGFDKGYTMCATRAAAAIRALASQPAAPAQQQSLGDLLMPKAKRDAWTAKHETSLAAPPVQQPDDVREAFEAWAKREGHSNLMRMAGDPDQYDDLILRANYKGYCAALATTRPSAALTALDLLKLTSIIQNAYVGESGEHLDAGPADAIARAILAACGAEQVGAEWISVDERLPEVGQGCIVYRPTAPESQDPVLKITHYTGRMQRDWQGVEHGFDCLVHPTHWMPLPAAPATPSNKKEG